MRIMVQTPGALNAGYKIGSFRAEKVSFKGPQLETFLPASSSEVELGAAGLEPF